jgi:hypothetical protein
MADFLNTTFKEVFNREGTDSRPEPSAKKYRTEL